MSAEWATTLEVIICVTVGWGISEVTRWLNDRRYYGKGEVK